MNFHVICGMPRSGSTLLCNVLNQNPRFHASSTSPLAHTIRSLSAVWSNSPEIKSDLLHDKVGAELRMQRTARACIQAWYDDVEPGCVVFDKGRLWNLNALLLHHLLPNAKLFVMVRDLRSIFASIERHHAKNPLLDQALKPEERTTYARADSMFAPEGILGMPITGVEDLLRRRLPYVQVIQYETFVERPALVLERLYAALAVDTMFPHDLDNVQNTATDADALYLHKFPHEGAGKVEPRSDDWHDVVPPDIASLIMGKFQTYNHAFGYR